MATFEGSSTPRESRHHATDSTAVRQALWVLSYAITMPLRRKARRAVYSEQEWGMLQASIGASKRGVAEQMPGASHEQIREVSMQQPETQAIDTDQFKVKIAAARAAGEAVVDPLAEARYQTLFSMLKEISSQWVPKGLTR